MQRLTGRDQSEVRARETDATAERVGKRDNLDKTAEGTDERVVEP